mgnify:CR=1 FL=1
MPAVDNTTIRLPVTVHPPGHLYYPRWRAELRLDGYRAVEPFEAYGDTREGALAELTQLTLRTVANTGHRPVLVIGPTGDQPTRTLHVIVPGRRGWTIHRVHDDAVTGMSRSSHPSAEQALAALLPTTGTQARVVRL